MLARFNSQSIGCDMSVYLLCPAKQNKLVEYGILKASQVQLKLLGYSLCEAEGTIFAKSKRQKIEIQLANRSFCHTERNISLKKESILR